MNNDCTNQAQRFLVLRDHNHSELRSKLKEKGFSDSDIDQTFDYLEQHRFLDEARYVQSFVRSNNRRHPEGRMIMARRLMAKGADPEVVRQQLAEIYTDDYVDDLIQQAADRLARHNRQVDRIALSKLGFTSGEINRHLSK